MFEQLKAFLQQVDAVVVFLFATAVVLLLTTGIFLTKFWKWAVRYRSYRRFLRRYLTATIEIWQYLPQFSAYVSSEPGNTFFRIPLVGVFVERTLLPATKSNGLLAEAAAFGSDVLHKNPENTLILGESGAGKSTLLQSIANRSAQNILTRKWWQPILRNRRFPILVNLSGYHNNMQSWNGQDGLANTFRTEMAMQSGHAYPDGLLEKLLAKKQCLLLLDGFDEIADPDIRNNFAENIRQFCETYPENPLLLTSRPGDVANSLPANDCWNVVSIQPLSAGQINSFISKRQDFTSGQIQQNFEQNILSGEQNWHLARNPLLLSLMHIPDVQTAGSPITHNQIFRQYLAAVCQSRKPENGQANPPETEFSGSALQAILEQTGLYLHEHQLISVNRERLIRDVLPKAVHLEKKGILPPKKLERILEALDAINPVFQCIYKENSSAEFRFAHLSIQQFLAANAMAIQPKNEAQIFDQLMQRYSQNPDWWHPVAWQAISQFKSQTKYLGKLSQHAELAAQIIANAGKSFSERFRRKTIRQLAETVSGANPENCLKIAKNDPHDHLLTLLLEHYRSGESVPAIGVTGECFGGDLWKSGFIQPANSDYLHSILNNKKKQHLWADVCGFLSRLSLFDDPEIQQLSAALNDEKAAVR
ncbi:NACHT domain-containing protein, partial [Candidatus Saccharibacteria bacterium]|nr:NACHT domain-containing protein [Candidatus Saccharibacteria bacterium]